MSAQVEAAVRLVVAEQAATPTEIVEVLVAAGWVEAPSSVECPIHGADCEAWK